MDVKEYISSGVLELYAMGALTDSERNEVEKACASHKEIAEEMERVQEAVNSYASAHGRHPRPEVRSEIMDKVRSGKGRVLMFGSTHETTYKYLIAACIASLI